MSTNTGNLLETGGMIRRHRMVKDTPALAVAGENGVKRKLEVWGVLIAAAVGAFSIGFFPTAAKAAVPSPVTPGAFCAEEDHFKFGQSADDDWYQCKLSEGVWRWKPTGTGSPTPTVSKPPTPSSTTKSPSPKPSQTTKKPASPRPTASPINPGEDLGGGPTLPRTGDSTPYVVGAGVVLVVAGVLLAFAARTRKVRVES